MLTLSPKRCDRAREWISLALDGELSRFEEALLERHLGGCGPCRVFSEETAGFTHALRTAPLERLERRVALPLRRPLALRPVAFAAAAVAAVSVGAMALVGSLNERDGHRVAQPAATSVRQELEGWRERQAQEREALVLGFTDAVSQAWEPGPQIL